MDAKKDENMDATKVGTKWAHNGVHQKWMQKGMQKWMQKMRQLWKQNMMKK